MNCAPERVTAYVDREVPPEERAAIETHLSACPACRSQAEFEAVVRERLRALAPVSVDAALGARVVQALRRGRPSRARRLVRAALPVAAVLVLALFWGRDAAPVVAWELAEDHDHCRILRSLALPADTPAPDARADAADLRGMPREVRGMPLVAASLCALRDGSVVLHLQYATDEGRVSLFVVDRPVRFDASYSRQVGQSQVRLVRAGGRVIGLVTDDGADLDAFARALAS